MVRSVSTLVLIVNGVFFSGSVVAGGAERCGDTPRWAEPVAYVDVRAVSSVNRGVRKKARVSPVDKDSWRKCATVHECAQHLVSNILCLMHELDLLSIDYPSQYGRQYLEDNLSRFARERDINVLVSILVHLAQCIEVYSYEEEACLDVAVEARYIQEREIEESKKHDNGSGYCCICQ